MNKTRKDFEREDDKRKDLKVLYFLIPIIIVAIFISWLFKDTTKDISKSYSGILVGANGADTQDVTAEIKGTVTYESYFSDNVAKFCFDIILKDSSGKIVLSTSSKGDSIHNGFTFSWEPTILTKFIEETASIEWIGKFYCDKDFKEILLHFDDNRYFAAPATNLEEADSIFNKSLTNSQN